MSKKARLIKTPMKIRVGETTHEFVTLEDVYDECLKNLRYFDDLAGAVAPVRAADPKDPNYESTKQRAKSQLGEALLSHDQVLPEKCFCTLFDKLTIQTNVDAARGWLEKGLSWKRSKRSALGQDARAKKTAKDRKGRGDLKDGSASDTCHWDDCPDQQGRA